MKPQAKESEITQLLTKSINRVKEKVCTIDQLHVKLDEEKLGMFNFGKGLIKPYLPMRATHEEQLGSIPEKLKQPSKSKRAPENGNPSIKKRKALHCLARPKTPFNLSKIGDEKLSSKC